MDGVVVINKPAGMTSHDVVARVRRLAGQRRVGHAGTLDPAATGVLPVLLGQATRVSEYLSESGKAYRATVRFGVETNTYDADGEVTAQRDIQVRLDAIEQVLPAFLGEQDQMPPIFSAIKRGGRPLYALARAGETVEVQPRRVTITALRVVALESPDLILDVECGKGTYIRSLAHDLGQRLGSGAHLAGLIRTRSGPFSLSQAVSLDEFGAMVADGTWRDHLYATDEALLDWNVAILGDANARRLMTGQPITFAQSRVERVGLASTQHDLIRGYSVDGRFLGILRWDESNQTFRPHKTFTIEPEADN